MVINMEIIHGTTDFQLNTDTAVAMGKFDGIHVGHRKLLESILEKKKSGLKACVFTFDPAPAVLFGHSDGRELSAREEKRILFEQMGVDILVEFPMTKETAAIPGDVFVREYLSEKLCARYIAAGEDVSFGSHGAGNAALLQSLQEELDYELRIIEKVCVDGEEVSSTRIRSLIESGEMEQAAALLSGSYTVRGVVSDGKKLGRTIGFPTANIYPGADKLMPRNGVYFSQVKIWHEKENGVEVYDAISNVGCKPTVSEESVMGVETYLYDFAGDIYGQTIEVELLAFHRPETRFESVDALQSQLQKDILTGRQWHNNTKNM